MLNSARLPGVAGTVLLALASAVPAAADPLPAAPADSSVFVLGGPFTSGYFGDAFLLWQDHYETNAFLGVGYQHFLYRHGSFQFGLEAGVGVRLGSPASLELWTGGVARLTRFTFGDLTITPALTAGFSLVTDTIGAETARAARAGEDAALLYYLGPEIAFSSATEPQWEAFARIQHRSGGFGIIAHLDGSNAVTLGLRYNF